MDVGYFYGIIYRIQILEIYMITTFLFYAIIYFFTSIDYLLNLIPLMSYVSAYSSRIGSTVYSFLGFFHQVLPETLALVCFYISIWFAVWIVFYVLGIIRAMLPVDF